MEIFVFLTMWMVILGAFYMIFRSRRKEREISEIITRWRKNPAKMDLSLATTKQILRELQTRPQPIILVMPDMPKLNGQPIKSIQVYVLGVPPELARVILHGAGELLGQEPPAGEIKDE
jgi:hypothetical protein